MIQNLFNYQGVNTKLYFMDYKGNEFTYNYLKNNIVLIYNNLTSDIMDSIENNKSSGMESVNDSSMKTLHRMRLYLLKRIMKMIF